MSDKAMPIECVVGSLSWVHTVQEDILDNRSLCFFCGEDITYKRDFFYMRGRMGTFMAHDTCFTPWTRQALNRVERTRHRETEQWALAGEWLDIHDAARLDGVSYMAIYQRIYAGTLQGEMRDGKWYVSRKAVLAWREGRRPTGHRQSARRATIPNRYPDTPKAKIWRSEVTEPIERITAHNAALKIGVSRSWILQRKERFDAVKISGAWMLSKKLVEDYIRDEEQSELEPAG